MPWVFLFALTLFLWAVCGAVMAIGRRVWGLETTPRVHLAVAPVFAFLVSVIHKVLAPEFSALLRAAAITGSIIVLDAGVVVPLFERSFAMFRRAMGTWIPFAAIFLASLAAGILVRVPPAERLHLGMRLCVLPDARTSGCQRSVRIISGAAMARGKSQYTLSLFASR